MGEYGDADARRELDRARDSLHDAQVLADGGGTDGGVLNRLYYAARVEEKSLVSNRS